MTENFITYLLSFIGFVPIQQLQEEQLLQEAVRDAEKCQFLVDSAFVLSSFMNLNINDETEADTEKEKKKKKNGAATLLDKLSRLNPCQILSDYPSVPVPESQRRQYEKVYIESMKARKQQQSQQKRKSGNSHHQSQGREDGLPSVPTLPRTPPSPPSPPPTYESLRDCLTGMSMTLEELKAFQLQARSVANSLNHLRRSEQFARATEVAVALEGMIRSLHLLQLSTDASKCSNSDSRHHRSSSFFFIMFGLITLGHESLYAPAEVRQQIFYQYKFGRRLILEMSTALKNFESTPVNASIHSSSYGSYYSSPSLYSSATSTIASSMTINGEAEGYLYWWSSLYEDEDWLSYLQDVCSKLVKYDITWEYRREYQDVVQIAERYFQTQRHHRNIL